MGFQARPTDDHGDVPRAGEVQREDCTAQWDAFRDRPPTENEDGNACYVLSVVRRRRSVPQAQLAEITGLVEAQGDQIVGRESQRLAEADPRTFIGSGVAKRVAAAAQECGLAILVDDAALSPPQTRNLEDLVGLPTCDPTAAIINVFERPAPDPRAPVQHETAPPQ